MQRVVVKKPLKIIASVLGALAVAYGIILCYFRPFWRQFHTVWIYTDSTGHSETLFSGGPPFSDEAKTWRVIRRNELSGLIRVLNKRTGVIKREFSVREGVQNGKDLVFDESGKVAVSEVEYCNGQLNGVYIGRFANGMVGDFRYYTNGVQEGVGLTFFEDGRAASIFNFKGGSLTGVAKSWDEVGNLLDHAFYDNSRPTGGVVLVGGAGQGPREVFDVIKRRTMTVAAFQQTLTKAERRQPSIREWAHLMSLDAHLSRTNSVMKR
jgi:hypothetical protein